MNKYIRLDEHSKRPEVGSKVRIEDNFKPGLFDLVKGKVYTVHSHSHVDHHFFVMNEDGERARVYTQEVSLVVEE